MNITSNSTVIFAKEFNGKMYYRAGIPRKNEDGSYARAYIDIKLPKGTNIADRTKINIENGFMSFYKNKNDENIFYIVVQQFKVVSEKKEETETKNDVYADFGNSITVEQLDNKLELPF